jgi:hypothetical protein
LTCADEGFGFCGKETASCFVTMSARPNGTARRTRTCWKSEHSGIYGQRSAGATVLLQLRSRAGSSGNNTTVRQIQPAARRHPLVAVNPWPTLLGMKGLETSFQRRRRLTAMFPEIGRTVFKSSIRGPQFTCHAAFTSLSGNPSKALLSYRSPVKKLWCKCWMAALRNQP